MSPHPGDPFATTADPAAYVPRQATEAALAELTSYLRVGATQIALCGPDGIGKTLLLRVLAARLEGRFETVYVPHAALPAEEVAAWVLGLLEVDAGDDPERGLVARARELREQGQGLVVLVDDAAGTPLPTLRRLSRLASEARPGMRLVLALRDADDTDEVLEAIGPGVEVVRLGELMSREETRSFLDARLARAQAPDWMRHRLRLDAADAIHDDAGGLPARVCQLASACWARLEAGAAPPGAEAPATPPGRLGAALLSGERVPDIDLLHPKEPEAAAPAPHPAGEEAGGAEGTAAAAEPAGAPAGPRAHQPEPPAPANAEPAPDAPAEDGERLAPPAAEPDGPAPPPPGGAPQPSPAGSAAPEPPRAAEEPPRTSARRERSRSLGRFLLPAAVAAGLALAFVAGRLTAPEPGPLPWSGWLAGEPAATGEPGDGPAAETAAATADPDARGAGASPPAGTAQRGPGAERGAPPFRERPPPAAEEMAETGPEASGDDVAAGPPSPPEVPQEPRAPAGPQATEPHTPSAAPPPAPEPPRRVARVDPSPPADAPGAGGTPEGAELPGPPSDAARSAAEAPPGTPAGGAAAETAERTPRATPEGAAAPPSAETLARPAADADADAGAPAAASAADAGSGAGEGARGEQAEESETLATPVPAPVRVSINAVPWARIEIDGAAVGVTPLADVALEPGPHTLRATFPDGRVQVRREEVDPLNRRFVFRPED